MQILGLWPLYMVPSGNDWNNSSSRGCELPANMDVTKDEKCWERRSSKQSICRVCNRGAEWAVRWFPVLIFAAIFWMIFSFFNWAEKAAVNTLLQYSRCDLTSATYTSFLSSIVKAGDARAIASRIPWHLLKILSMWVHKVRCWSKVTPRSLTEE